MIAPTTIFVSNKTNIRFLSGFRGTAGYVVMIGKKGFLFTDSRYHLVAKKVLPKTFELIDTTVGFSKVWREFMQKHRLKKMGIESDDITLSFFNKMRELSPGVELIAMGDEIKSKRMQKKKAELDAIAGAQKITDAIFDILRRWLTPGVREKDIAWKIEMLGHELGADGVSFPPIVGINENSASPHHHVSEKRIKKGDLILIDMGVIYKGYCSDMTRMLFTKPPTTLQEKVYETVRGAQAAGIDAVKAGVKGNFVDSVARTFIKKEGYGDHFGHSLGHGVGLDVHELPNLSQKYEKTLPENAVVTVEPGIYLPGKFGVRIEDMLIVKKNGSQLLTKSKKLIKDCIIKL